MVITLIVLHSLWRVWRQRESQRSLLARMNARELADIGLTDAERQVEVDAPLWRDVFAKYQHNASRRREKRMRTQQAISRLSRMEQRARRDHSPQHRMRTTSRAVRG